MSIKPQLKAVSDGDVVPIKIKNPRGALITIAEVNPNTTTVGQLKQMVYQKNRKFTLERQRYTYRSETNRHQIILKDRFLLSSYRIGAGDSIVFRDLGMHYPWKTEYLFENLLLVSSYLLFYAFHEAYRPSHTTTFAQQVALGCWILPHALAVLEIIILPTSKRLAPFALTLKVAIPHSILAMLTSYYINGPHFDPMNGLLQMNELHFWLAIFITCHVLRFIVHLSRRKMIPFDFTVSQAVLEIVGWATYFYFLHFWVIGILFLSCTLWKQYIYKRIRADNS